MHDISALTGLILFTIIMAGTGVSSIALLITGIYAIKQWLRSREETSDRELNGKPYSEERDADR